MNGISGNAWAQSSDDFTQKCQANAEISRDLNQAALDAGLIIRASASPVYVGDIGFIDAEGNAKTLADLRGKTLLVNVWATWCAPCRKEMPDLDALHRLKGGDNFAVVALNVDRSEDNKVAAYYQQNNIQNLEIYRDPKMQAFNQLRSRNLVFGLPATILVDSQGCQIANMSGPAPWADDNALTYIDRVLEIEHQNKVQ